jgi:ankyrin repeat protein
MLLAKLGADINSADNKDGMTPLFYAIQHPEKALELTQGLLAQGADSSVLTQVIAKHGDAVLLQLGVQEAAVDSLVKIIKDHELAEQASAAEGEVLPLEVEISALSLQTPEEFKGAEVEYLGGVEQPDSDL